ncbi:metallophosphoesterase [Sulfurovum lithotrophicum]|uniref:Metallophosphoesterase n=1 Tax=Sulfurovum lithotrophicum TaxID=206403 RepID=A0A7U4RQP5_9BACT|nr:metallophosphoesterase [Sulfurovum lithotrophicum]AKF25093.1 metallophosphoesterase [Sulfurovum lithotrophicum]
MQKSLRILHFSDIHVNIQIRHMHWKKWFSKRAIGAINLLRGRASYFDDTEKKLAALVRFKEENDIDIVINTGDYTALGLRSELILARQLLDPFMTPPQNYITVPGNHDIYVHEGNSHYRFSEQFCSVLQNDLPEYCRGGHWPLIRLLGDNAAVIAIDSARPNPVPWKSSGEIPPEQLQALEEILKDERVKGRFLFVMTHYAPRLSNGEPDKKLHGLINADDFLETCKGIENGAILFGHIHKTYRLHVPGVKSELFCAGSATMQGHEGCWVYEMEGKKMQAKQIGWDGENYCFVE